MPASSADPKTYVRQVPIPVTSHKGIRIQARSHTIYNATIPTRDEVRHENYSRRQMQMSYQGFQSAKNRPYQGIGDPFYLEPRKLVLHALGQWDDEDDCKPPDTDEPVIEEDILHSKQKDGHKHKMHASRKKNDTNELNKRLAYGRRMIRTVSLGRSFQNIVRAEAENKIRMAEKELNDARELMRTTMRPPKIKSSLSSSSSSSFDDEEVDDDNDGDYDDDDHHNCVMNGSGDLQECASRETWRFNPYKLRPFSSVVAHSRDSLKVQDAKTIPKSKSASGIRDRSQKVAQRPYTPQHSNIAAVCNSSTNIGSVFRQLCVVYWLLEAMNLDPPRITRPVTTCWNTSDVNETDNDRNKRFGIDRAKLESKLETRWKQFSSAQTVKANRRGAKLRANATKITRPEGTHNFESASVCSVSDTWDQRSHTAPTDDNTTHEEIEAASNQLESTSKSDTTEFSRNKCPSPKNFENQDVFPASRPVRQDSSLSEMSLNSSHLRKQNSVQLTKTLDPVKSKAERKEQQQLKHLEIINRIDQADQESHTRQQSGLPKILPAEANAEAHAEANVRPKSSAAVLQHREPLPSDKLKNMTQKLRQQFAEVSREQDMILKDALNALDRNRLKEVEHKFDIMPTDADLRTALQVIRLKEESKQENKAEKEPEIYQPWFLILMKSLSEEMKSSWFFQKMLDKLSRYGLVEAGKQSDFKFIKILAGLREWEICSPDISAAVEFCREKIVEMNVDEYEKWFGETFPRISRPQPENLPAKSIKKEEPVPWHRSVDRNRAKSAPMNIRQARI